MIRNESYADVALGQGHLADEPVENHDSSLTTVHPLVAEHRERLRKELYRDAESVLSEFDAMRENIQDAVASRVEGRVLNRIVSELDGALAARPRNTVGECLGV